MTLLAHQQCPGRATQFRSFSVAYAPMNGFVGAWSLTDSASSVNMFYGQYFATDSFYLYTTGTESACVATQLGGGAQYDLLQQVANLTALVGTWSGYSATSSEFSQPNDCYRVGSLTFYDDPTAASGKSVEVIYIRHDTTTYDLYWATQRSPVVLSAEPVTTSARLQMLLPMDPSGVAHTLATIDASSAATPTQPITWHGTNSKCNAIFVSRSTSNMQAATGNVTSFAIRIFGASLDPTSTAESDLAQLVSRCTMDARVNSTLITGDTGQCFDLTNGKWGVVRFAMDDTFKIYLYNDHICQNRTTTTSFSGSSDVLAAGTAGQCTSFGSFKGQTAYAVVQHASSQTQAAAAVTAVDNQPQPAGPGEAASRSTDSKFILIVGVAVAAGALLLGIAAGSYYYCRRSKPANDQYELTTVKVAPHPAHTNAAHAHKLQC